MIVYTDSLEGITPERLGGFFHGWAEAPSPHEHLKILQNSDYVVLAIDDRTGKVIGFVTAVTDRVLTAFIPYLEVLPRYRSQGVGRELTRRMLEKLRDFYLVQLVCGFGLEEFYGSFGMSPINGMMLRNPGAVREVK